MLQTIERQVSIQAVLRRSWLRLRYELIREFAPYIGVNWLKKFDNTADFSQVEGESASKTQIVLGLRAWFLNYCKRDINMKKIVKLLATSLLLLSSTAFAHSGLSASTPANRAMLMETPKKLALEFASDVRLLKLKLSTQQGRQIKFNFKPSGKGASEYSYQLPELAVGNYKVEWMAMGGDAHKMKGKFNFMVHGDGIKMKSTMVKAKDSHNGHQH